MNNAFQNKIAIVGMGCRFPGANDIEQFWKVLVEGKNTVSRFTPDELIQSGVTEKELTNHKYVPARGIITLNKTPSEDLSDQSSVLWHTTREALQQLTSFNKESLKKTSIFCGAVGEASSPCTKDDPPALATLLGIKNLTYARSLASVLAYQLGAQGAAIDLYTGCSTSLVLVIQAIQDLLLHRSDIAIAGAISLQTPQQFGYHYEENGILSSDGYCRTFDAKADGAVLSNGCGVVILKRLVDAIKSGDNIHAVIDGYAANNDGRLKPGFFAPGINGQYDCIKYAWENCGVDPSELDYVEMHGSATPTGDPIEFFALNKVFQGSNLKKHQCAIGSVKTNIGHAVTASGMAALIKTALMLTRRTLVPTLHFEKINPNIMITDTPFYIATACQPLSNSKKRLAAGVSNFGFGGTNTHLVVTNYTDI